MSRQKTFSNLNSIILILIGFVFVFLSIYYDDTTKEMAASSSAQSNIDKKPVDLINAHLERSYDQEVIRQINANNENKILAPSLQNAPAEIPLTEEEVSSLFGGIKYEDMISKELTAQDEIQEKIEKQELAAKDDLEIEDTKKKFRQKYAATFIEKAKKSGYEIELDSDFRIKSAKKITNLKK